MTDAKRDSNSVPTLLGSSNADGVTPVRIQADGTLHGLLIDDNSTGSDNGRTIAARDGNSVPVIMAISSADGQTPVEVYADPATGKMLVNSN